MNAQSEARRRHGSQRGYVLAMNLAVLALMLLGASYVGQRVQDAVRLANAERQSVNAAYELESANSRLLMLLATTPRTTRGLGTLQNNVNLDGRTYRLTDTVLVNLQDARGLFSINGTNLGGGGRERVERMLGTFGVSSEHAVALTDALLDYRDADDLRRLNGAEASEYRAAGLDRGPRNGDLLSATELQRVYGWRDTPELWGADPITNHVIAQRRSQFNPNTADWRALVAMAGIESVTAKALVASRKQDQLIQQGDLSSLLFGPSVGDPFGVSSFVTPFPGPTLIVTLRVASAPWGYQMVVTHTPGEIGGPWRIAAFARLALPPAPESLKDVPKLPDAALLRDPSHSGQIESPF